MHLEEELLDRAHRLLVAAVFARRQVVSVRHLRGRWPAASRLVRELQDTPEGRVLRRLVEDRAQELRAVARAAGAGETVEERVAVWALVATEEAARLLEAGAAGPGELGLDAESRSAVLPDRRVALTTREYLVLDALLRHRGQVLSREQLLSHAWGVAPEAGSNVVDVYVGYLRRKLGADRIQTVRGRGYRLSPPSARCATTT